MTRGFLTPEEVADAVGNTTVLLVPLPPNALFRLAHASLTDLRVTENLDPRRTAYVANRRGKLSPIVVRGATVIDGSHRVMEARRAGTLSLLAYVLVEE